MKTQRWFVHFKLRELRRQKGDLLAEAQNLKHMPKGVLGNQEAAPYGTRSSRFASGVLSSARATLQCKVSSARPSKASLMLQDLPEH